MHISCFTKTKIKFKFHQFCLVKGFLGATLVVRTFLIFLQRCFLVQHTSLDWDVRQCLKTNVTHLAYVEIFKKLLESYLLKVGKLIIAREQGQTTTDLGAKAAPSGSSHEFE